MQKIWESALAFVGGTLGMFFGAAALILFFVFVYAMTETKKREKKRAEDEMAESPDLAVLLTQISDARR